MNFPAKIAVISDLHIHEAGTNPGEALKNVLKKFQEFAVKDGVSADYLMINGDITNRGNRAELESAWEFIGAVADILGVGKEKILFVPGNHDKNWDAYKALNGLSQDQRNEASYALFFQDDKKNVLFDSYERCVGSYDKFPYFVSWEFDDLVVLGYNSAAFDDGEKLPATPHNGKIDRSCLDELRGFLGSKRLEWKEKLKILITHHHPFQYEDVLTELWPDFSVMENGGGLLDVAHGFGFDFVLHGHKHVPYFHTYTDGYGKPVVLFCAGTFSSSIPSELNSLILNQFHLIEISEFDAEGDVFCGFIYNWRYRNIFGWEKSVPDSCRIDHCLPFGRFGNYAKIKQDFSEGINSEFAKRSAVKLSEIESANKEIQFVARKNKLRIIEDLSREMNFIVMPMADGDLVLLNGGA